MEIGEISYLCMCFLHSSVLLEKANDPLTNYQKQIVNKSLTKFVTRLVTD